MRFVCHPNNMAEHQDVLSGCGLRLARVTDFLFRGAILHLVVSEIL